MLSSCHTFMLTHVGLFRGTRHSQHVGALLLWFSVATSSCGKKDGLWNPLKLQDRLNSPGGEGWQNGRVRFQRAPPQSQFHLTETTFYKHLSVQILTAVGGIKKTKQISHSRCSSNAKYTHFYRRNGAQMESFARRPHRRCLTRTRSRSFLVN